MTPKIPMNSVTLFHRTDVLVQHSVADRSVVDLSVRECHTD